MLKISIIAASMLLPLAALCFDMRAEKAGGRWF
jgi:hypothetical protein